MGRIRTTLIKRIGNEYVDKFYEQLSTDFKVNKPKLDELAEIQTKRLRNMIAGYVTHLMKIKKAEQIKLGLEK